MKKQTELQKFLDKETETNEEWIAQRILTSISKTEIKQIKRSLKKLHDVCYKSWAREMSLDTFLVQIIFSEALHNMQEESDVQD